MSVTGDPQPVGLLAGRRVVVTGVVTMRSIGFAVAAHAQALGADVVLTSFGRATRMTVRASRSLPREVDVLELDVTRPDHFEALREALDERWGRVDGLVHAIAFAPPDALGGGFLETSAASAASAFQISAHSFAALGQTLLPLLERSTSSVVGLDFDASQAWPGYDWMGVAKGALETVSRYMAMYMGPSGVRVNLVSAGPLRTPAASGVPSFESMCERWREGAPLGWDIEDPGPVAGAVCFLLSDLAAGITGEIVHVDGGFHAVGGGRCANGDGARRALATADPVGA